MSYKLLNSFFVVASLSFTALTAASSFAGISAGMPVDSVGMEKKGNKVLVLYKVGPGETLSSISRKYNTSVEAIKAENVISGSGLKLGDVIKVPYTARPSFAGKKVHTVEASQTLYSIARMYNVTTEDIKKWNNLSVNEISLGQQLVVGGESASVAQTTSKSEPATANVEAAPSTQAATPRTNAAGQKIHVVAASQGLFSIARMYDIPVENLKKWNKLTDNNLKPGQELLLEDPGQQAQATIDEPQQAQEAEAPANEPAQPAKPRQTETAATTVIAETKPAKAAENKPATRNDNVQENMAVSNTSGFVKKVESGLAEVIESGNSDMFLALHRSAPVGTIMQVRNQMNDLSVFVKVIGKLPDTGANDKVVVKISRKAYERLAAIDKRFRVELSYMPN